MTAHPIHTAMLSEQTSIVESLSGGRLLNLQDELFGALAENVLTGDALLMARTYDDQESLIETGIERLVRQARAALAAGANPRDVAAILSRVLTALRQAQALDQAERRAHEQAEQHRQRDGDAVRVVSARVELARLRGAGGRQ